MTYPAHSLPSLILTAICAAPILTSTLDAQVTEWFFDKAITYRQSADDTQPATPVAWVVEIAIATENPGDATSAKIIGGGTGVSGLPLEYEDGEWLLEMTFESEAAMDAIFPSSTVYELSITGGTLGTLTQGISFGAKDYPEVPYLTGLDHSTSQNIGANSGFTFHWNAPGASANSVSLEIENPIAGTEVAGYEFESLPLATSQTLASNLLDPGYAYSAYLSFFNSAEATGGFGTTGFLDHSTNLAFDFQTLLNPTADDIVGAWQFGDSTAYDSGLLVFQSNGIYFHVEDPSPESSDLAGIEIGTYSLNEAGEITVNILVDTNGEIGLSDPGGVDVFTVDGDSLLLTAVDGTYHLDRIDSTPASPLIGAWRLCDNSDSQTGVLVFLGNGYYFHAEVTDGVFPSGMERGTYTWNAATGVLSATPITDTNGELGLSDPLVGYDEVTVTGNVSLRIYDGEAFFLHRISNAGVLPDWRINKARNFTQTAANTAPTTENFWDIWASVETVNEGDAEMVTISGGNLGSPRSFTYEGEGEWTYEKDYPTQAALDAEFPDGQSYTLTITGGALGTRVQTLNIGSEAYPPAPYLTGSKLTDAQSIDPDSNFNFTWNPPNGSGTQLVLTSEPDEEGIEYFYESDFFSGTSTGATVPAGTLAAGISGYGYLEFGRGSTNSDGIGGFGVSGFSGRQSITLDFTFATLGGDDGGFGDAAVDAGLTGADALPNATPFGDGVDNLLKFAFNMDLTGFDNGSLAPGGNSGLPTFSLNDEGGNTSFELEFVRRVGSSLTYIPQRATSLDNFATMTGAVTITPIAGGEFERVTVSEPCDPAVIPRCFGRVLVSAP